MYFHLRSNPSSTSGLYSPSESVTPCSLAKTSTPYLSMGFHSPSRSPSTAGHPVARDRAARARRFGVHYRKRRCLPRLNGRSARWASHTIPPHPSLRVPFRLTASPADTIKTPGSTSASTHSRPEGLQRASTKAFSGMSPLGVCPVWGCDNASTQSKLRVPPGPRSLGLEPLVKRDLGPRFAARHR